MTDRYANKKPKRYYFEDEDEQKPEKQEEKQEEKEELDDYEKYRRSKSGFSEKNPRPKFQTIDKVELKEGEDVEEDYDNE